MTRAAVLHPETTETADVVVVGAGDAGLMAAIEAAEAGANVVVLQKLPEPGGKSSLAIGSISAAGTSMQRARGIVDDEQDHLRDLRARIDRGKIEPLSMEKLTLVVEHGAECIERLIALGVAFSGPHPEVQGEAWRMHVITPDARSLVVTLADQARRRGCPDPGDWSVDALVLDDHGAVTGVRGPRGTVLARRHVVLATGDFSSPPALGAVAPEGAEWAFRPWASGDGHYLAESVGGVITHMDRPLRPQLRSVDWPHIEPHPSLFAAGAVLVNRLGERVADETDNPALAIAAGGGDEDLFLVMDGKVCARMATAADDSAVARDGWFTKGKLYVGTFPGVAYGYLDDVIQAGYGTRETTLQALGDRLGMYGDGLLKGMDGYNQAIADGLPDPLGRVDRRTVDEPEFFGCGPFRVRAILGRAGIRTDEQMRVTHQTDARPIEGLLAVGAAAGVTGFAYGHGYELAWAVTSGMLAGRLAAQGV